MKDMARSIDRGHSPDVHVSFAAAATEGVPFGLKTSGQIFLQNWLQTQAEVDTPLRCHEPPWNNDLTPGFPPRPIRLLSFPSLAPPALDDTFSVDTFSAPPSVEIPRRNLSSRIPGDFAGDISGELIDDPFDFNDFSCIANALKDNTFSGMSSFDSQDHYYDEPEGSPYSNLPFLSQTHSQLGQLLRRRTERPPTDTSDTHDNHDEVPSCDQGSNDTNLSDAANAEDTCDEAEKTSTNCSCRSDISNGPTPITTLPRDTGVQSGAHRTTEAALEMLSIIASLDTITINKLHRLFSIAGQGDTTLALERIRYHIRPGQSLQSLFDVDFNNAADSIVTEEPAALMLSETTPLLAQAKAQARSKAMRDGDDTKHSTWQRVRRRVSNSFKV